MEREIMTTSRKDGSTSQTHGMPPVRTCKVCGKPTNQWEYSEKTGNYSETHVDCDCRKREPRERRIKAYRERGYFDAAYDGITFAVDGNYNPQHTKAAKRYVEHWAHMREKGIGMIFYGGVGSGKTFTAACIANALMERCVPVGMLSANKIVNMQLDVYNVFASGTTQGRMELLVIDDLGAERGTDYAKERVFGIIDERTKRNLPMIVTTNHDPETLLNIEDEGLRRIFDRIGARGMPLLFNRPSIRREQNKKILSEAARILTGQNAASR